MKFQRGKDPKEALRIGKLWSAYKVAFIYLKIQDLSIPDLRSDSERKITPNPQTVSEKKLTGEHAHKILQVMKTSFSLNSRKTFWNFIIELFPEQTQEIKDNKFSCAFMLALDEKGKPYHPSIEGNAFLSFRKCIGKDLLYEGKIYSMPETSEL
jgi:hypothetical protein